LNNLEMIPFHTHNVYSLLDGILQTDQYIQWAIDNNIKSIGLANHGELSGCLELYKKCNKADIKPILACEFYLTANEEENINDNMHIVVIAYNNDGWNNLIKLHNYSWKNFYRKPRITFSKLKEFNEGLIVTTACMGGIFAKPYFDNVDIEPIIEQYIDIFEGRFYLELQEHGIKGQREYNEFLIELAKKYNLPLIIQNDAHYASKDDAFAHEVLLCKNTGSKMSSEKRFKFDTNEFYLKNKSELKEIFDYLPDDIFEECILNTNIIADSCNVILKQDGYNYPVFSEDKKESFRKLVELTKQGYVERFKDRVVDTKIYIDRLKYELETINQIGFVDYFILLYDMYQFCEKEDIYTGFGRGSATASLVLYCLNVTHIDPIEYNLYFERFINIHRISAPDVDCDIDDNDRYKVIDYLTKKYGDDYVAYISTYGTFTSKASFKAVASILEMPFQDANKITNYINTKQTLAQNLQENNILQELYNNNELFKKIYDVAGKLENIKDKRGLHACGQIISNQPLDNICPAVVVKDTKGNKVKASAFSMKEVDGDLKLLKLDVLGLSNLSIVRECIETIKKQHDIFIDFKKLDFKDKKTYDMLCDGDSFGVFQFESKLMKSLLRKIRPRTLEELSVVNAAARPGALDSKLTEAYIRRRNGEEEISYLCPTLENYMKDTLGLMIYQENVMQVVRELADFSMAEADSMRYVIGKKVIKDMPLQKQKFIDGCVNNGYEQVFAERVFSDIEKFANYGFALPHSIAYSALSYVTAYLKCNYRVEYMTSYLNAISNNADKLSSCIANCFQTGIKILPPDINISTDKFEIDENNNIRFSFSSLKGLGEAVIKPLMQERNKNGNFKSIEDLIKRVPKLDKSAIECLCRVGALNSIIEKPYNAKFYYNLTEYISDAKKNTEQNIMYSVMEIIAKKKHKNSDEYKQLMENKKSIKGASKQAKKDKQLIDIDIDKLYNNIYENIEEDLLCDDFTKAEYSASEEELMGYSISFHPLILFAKYDKYFDYTSMPDLLDEESNYEYLCLDDNGYAVEFSTIALIENIKEITTRNNNKMGFVEVQYLGSKVSFSCPPWIWEKLNKELYNKGDLVLIKGTMEENDNKSFSDYRFGLKNISKLTFINNDDNMAIIDINDKTNQDMAKIRNIIKDLSRLNISDNKEIKYITIFKKDNRLKILKSIYWLSDKKELMSELYHNNLI